MSSVLGLTNLDTDDFQGMKFSTHLWIQVKFSTMIYFLLFFQVFNDNLTVPFDFKFLLECVLKM